MSELEITNVTDLCRACLKPTDLKLGHSLSDIVKFNEDTFKVNDLFQYYTKLQASDANPARFPTRVCSECFHRLEQSHQFAKLVRRTDKFLISLSALRLQSIAKEDAIAEDSFADDTAASDVDPVPLEITHYAIRPLPFHTRTKAPKTKKAKPRKNLPPRSYLSTPAPRQIKILPKGITGTTVASSICLVESAPNIFSIQNPSINKSYDCTECPKKFISEECLKAHTAERHSIAKRTRNAQVVLKGSKRQCEVCHKVFKNLKSVNRHIGKVHPGAPIISEETTDQANGQANASIKAISCPTCNRKCKSEEQLERHRNRYHTVNMCKQCHTCFATADNLYQHQESNHLDNRRPFACVMCQKNFSTRTYLDQHVRVTHKEGVVFYYCGECKDDLKIFADYGLVQQHLTEEHEQSETTNPDDGEAVYYAVVNGPGGDKLVKLPAKAVKNLVFEEIKDLKDPLDLTQQKELHSSRPRDVMIEIVGFDDEIDKESFKPSGSGKFECAHCGLFITRKYNLRRHLAIAHQLRTLECKCGKLFDNVAALNQHKSTHVTPPIRKSTINKKTEFSRKNYTCLLCKNQWRSFRKLHAHTLVEHGQEEGDKLEKDRFLCKICGRKLKSYTGFKYHMYKHAGMRFQVCEICGHRSLTKMSLLKHIQTKHSTEKPFLCQHCGKAYATKDHLQKHISLTHSGGHDFLCGICGKTFQQSSHAKQHMWKHTGIKPKECRYCSNAYTHATTLKNHLEKFHKEEEKARLLEAEKRREILRGVSFDTLLSTLFKERSVNRKVETIKKEERTKKETLQTEV